MIQSYLARDEGKTLEFKENCKSLQHIVQTAVAFTNTAGGSIVIGVRDRTKEVVGITNPLAEEERLANAFADGIQPLLIPDIQIHSWRDRELIVVTIPHAIGPYFLRSEGPDSGVYIRLGSTNRRADPEMIAEIRLLSRNTFFDEQPRTEISSEEVDFRAASELFAAVSRPLNFPKRKSLGLVVEYRGQEVPTNGAVLLFGKNRRYLAQKGQISTQEAARLWKTSDRTARTRLRKLATDGVLAEMGTGPKDPYRTYILKEGYPE